MRPVVTKKSTKTAFDGDIIQACRLTDEAITDILEPYKRSKRKPQSDRDEVNSVEFNVNSGQQAHVRKVQRIRIGDKPKTVSFMQNRLKEENVSDL